MSDTTAVPASTVTSTLLEEGRVLRLVVDRPKGNILDKATMEALGAALTRHQGDLKLKLVLLRGAGGHFSFGASVEEHRPAQAPAMLRTLHTLVRQIATFPVPVAALVEGRCLGGAFEVVLCCHLVLATRNARFACPEVKLGVFPPVLAAAGATRLGGALAERLALTGDEIDAQTALGCGFASAILPGESDPESEALAWYRQRLAPLSAFSLRATTRAAREGSGLLAALGEPLDRTERAYLEHLLPSHDGNEGIEAFLARRPPAWQDA